MKICYVANSRFPSERAHMTQIVQMCNAFAEAGHAVTVLVTDRKTDIEESPEIFFGVPLKFSVERIRVPDIAGVSPKIPPIFRPYFFLIQRFLYAIRAARFIREGLYTHVYGRDEGILLYLGRATEAKIVWESHEAKHGLFARMLIPQLTLLVVISEGIRDAYLKRGVSESLMFVAHDAVDDRFFEAHLSKEEARARLGITPAKPAVFYIGGLESWKGAEVFFEAAADQDAFEAYVVGGKESELPQFKTAYPHVRFLGPRPYRDLPRLQQAADVLVIPNTGREALSAQYTSPLKLFAYMTSKKPIVASRLPSITNILSEDEAYFFTPDDPASLSRTLAEALRDPEREARARKVYEKSLRHTWSKRADSILDRLPV